MRIWKNQQQLNFALVKRMKLTINRSCKTYVEEKLVLRTTNSLIKWRCLKPVNSTASTAAVVRNYWEEWTLFSCSQHKTNKCLQHFWSMIVLMTTSSLKQWNQRLMRMTQQLTVAGLRSCDTEWYFSSFLITAFWRTFKVKAKSLIIHAFQYARKVQQQLIQSNWIHAIPD